jgi:hypothetical protein
MVDALAAVLEPKTQLTMTTQPVRGPMLADRLKTFQWRRWAWASLPVAALLASVVIFVIVPRLHQRPATPPTNPATGVVACPEVSPSPPQVAVSPNPADASSPVSYVLSGFAAGVPLFVVVDAAGDCTNPTAGVIVYSTSNYAETPATKPSPLPDSVTPGDYQLRACNHGPGQAPTNCVQVPFSVTAAASPSPATTPSASPTPT